MLTRIDEFVGMLDMVISFSLDRSRNIHAFTSLRASHVSVSFQIRNDTSQIVSENLPQIQQKSAEMRQIYRRIDKLEVSAAASVNAEIFETDRRWINCGITPPGSNLTLPLLFY